MISVFSCFKQYIKRFNPLLHLKNKVLENASGNPWILICRTSEDKLTLCFGLHYLYSLINFCLTDRLPDDYCIVIQFEPEVWNYSKKNCQPKSFWFFTPLQVITTISYKAFCSHWQLPLNHCAPWFCTIFVDLFLCLKMQVAHTQRVSAFLDITIASLILSLLNK